MKKSINEVEHYTWGSNCDADAWHLLKSPSLSVIREKIPSGSGEELHCHLTAQQLFVVLAGIATFKVNGEVFRVAAHESLHVPARAIHNIRNEESQELEFLVVSEPPSHGDRLEIIAYHPDLKHHIKDLNIEWLEKYFRVEDNDIVQLSDPDDEIVAKGGLIFYAKYNGSIVGTASLLKIDDRRFELGKMAVTGSMQGLGIGKILLEHCLAAARAQGTKSLELYSNTSLSSAIHLYKKHGFFEVPLEPGHYQRANIKMELLL